MDSYQEILYNQLKKTLEKNMQAQKDYLKASELAKKDDVKLFFEQKAYQRNVFNEKLLFELNYTFPSPKISFSTSLQRAWIDIKDRLLDTSDECMLKESLRDDKAALNDYEELLKQDFLPLSIKFIIREQVTVIKLDRLKMEQLLRYSK